MTYMQKKQPKIKSSAVVNSVLPLGLEPRTPTLRVSCSTSWAKEAFASANVQTLFVTPNFLYVFLWITRFFGPRINCSTLVFPLRSPRGPNKTKQWVAGNFFCFYTPMSANKFEPKHIKTKRCRLLDISLLCFVGVDGFEPPTLCL